MKNYLRLSTKNIEITASNKMIFEDGTHPSIGSSKNQNKRLTEVPSTFLLH